jgi:hypothetical protein
MMKGMRHERQRADSTLFGRLDQIARSTKNGQRVEHPTRGLYIRNGRKVIF